MNPLDRFRLDDKVVVITGASSGLGVGFARTVAAVGATVVLAARREDRLETLATELREQGTTVLTRRTDVSVLEDCEALGVLADPGQSRVFALLAVVPDPRYRMADVATRTSTTCIPAARS